MVLSPQGPLNITSMPFAAASSAAPASSGAQQVAAASAATPAAQGSGASAAAGASPQQPVVVEGGEQLDFSWEGTLLAAPPAAAAAAAGGSPAALIAPLHLGTALDAAAAALPTGTAHYFQLGSALTMNASLQACSPQAPLHVAVFAGADSAASWWAGGASIWDGQREPACSLRLRVPIGKPFLQAHAWLKHIHPSCCQPLPAHPSHRLSTEPCTNTASGSPCTATSASADGCSSLSGLVLPGQGNGPPVTIAVLPLAPASAAVGAAPAAGVRLRLTAVPVPPVFTSLP